MPATPLHLLRVNARELLRQPGLRKDISTVLQPSLLGVDDERINGDLTIGLVAESSIDGISVRGSIEFPWSASCRRCLTAVTDVARIVVDEVYQDDAVADEDAFPIEGDQIDLAPVVREHVLLELPDDPLCKADCAGICPLCGTDRNLADCSCDLTVRDERWAALDELRLDD